MNRTVVAVLAVAALLGGTGGAVAAVAHGGDHPAPAAGGGRPSPATHASPTPGRPSSPSSTPGSADPSGADTSPTPSSSTTTETNEPLLYAASGVIHDGGRSTPFREKGRIDRLVRVSDGWLVSTVTSERSAEVQLWHVRPSSAPVRLAGVVDWDVDADGTHVTAFDMETSEVRVWSLSKDVPLGSFGTQGGQAMAPFFVGGDVYISDPTGKAKAVTIWNIQTGETRDVEPGYRIDGVSPGGSYLTGGLGDAGASTYGCRMVRSTPLKKYPVSWKTCDDHSDVTPTRFSPDGTKLLLVPNDAKPLEPRLFLVIDVTDGPSKPYAAVKVPPGSQGAEFADSSHLYVYGSDDSGSTGATWVKTCDFTGGCRDTVATRSALVVGSGV